MVKPAASSTKNVDLSWLETVNCQLDSQLSIREVLRRRESFNLCQVLPEPRKLRLAGRIKIANCYRGSDSPFQEQTRTVVNRQVSAWRARTTSWGTSPTGPPTNKLTRINASSSLDNILKCFDMKPKRPLKFA